MMTEYPQAEKIDEIIKSANKIVIVQADNPDADSIGSALALESILGEMGKNTQLYCAADMPSYLRYMLGWDRVEKDLPKDFDASVIVDASTMTLFERLVQSGQKGWLASKPCVVLDHHHTVENVVDFADESLNDYSRASTGELIFLLAKQLNWPLNLDAQEYIMSSILGDTQGLSNQLTTAETYLIMSEMVKFGVNRPQLEELRRKYSKMPQDIYKYKSELIKRTEFACDGKLASVIIPQSEINRYSPLYNPAPLIQTDMLQTEGVEIAVVLKSYDDGRITGAIRSNLSAPVAAELAEHMGGGGHKHASGFKIINAKSVDQVKSDVINQATGLLVKTI